jgi:hypothetical protein
LRRRRFALLRLLSALGLAASSPVAASAEISFYTDEGAWRAAWQASAGPSARTIPFDTTPQNMALAWVAYPGPGPNAVYPGVF